MTTPESELFARIAYRQEGDMWAAYYAKPDTMEDAVMLGSIHMILIGFSDVKEVFMDTMRHSVSLIVRESSGGDIKFGDLVPAPESERSGRA